MCTKAKITRRKRWPWLSAKLSRYFRNEDGVVAIEFGAVSVPFFLVIIGSLETAVVFMAGMALDHGMHDAARFVQTGQALAGGMTESAFKKRICDAAVMIPDCENSLKVDVRDYDNFEDATFPPMTKPNGDLLDDADYQFDIGQSESTVVVRISYEWPLLNSFFNSGLGNMTNGSGNRLLISSWAFKNEPF